MVYVSRHPIDDESNYHVPSAQIAALYANANRAKGKSAFSLLDFLPFRRRKPDVDLEQQLLHGDW